MKVSKKGIDLIKQFEGLRLKAYLDPIGIPTIGYGSIMWPDGKKVQMGQQISAEQAEKMLQWEVDKKTVPVEYLLKGICVNQNQFDALVSFAYNLGIGALTKSTLVKKVKADVNDPLIRNEFNKWVNAGGKKLPGLVRRRKAEADLYFS
jgi:lysozyme